MMKIVIIFFVKEIDVSLLHRVYVLLVCQFSCTIIKIFVIKNLINVTCLKM